MRSQALNESADKPKSSSLYILASSADGFMVTLRSVTASQISLVSIGRV
jgi:hypothetical protein